MTKDQVKKITKAVVPMLLALAAAYGYVDSTCQCGAPEAPAQSAE